MRQIKLYNSLMILALMIGSVIISSCSNDDENDNHNNGAGYHHNAATVKPQAVDLGLSVKWADMNVGATTPEDVGDHFAWGETKPKSTYYDNNYKWYNDSHHTFTKYCTDSEIGKVDYKTTLDPEDDAAHANWGGAWRMPTPSEQDELRNNCTWTWTSQNGVNGYKVVGPNGNSIFLPTTAYQSSNGGYIGCYWSSSLSKDDYNDSYYNTYYASSLNFNVFLVMSNGTLLRSYRGGVRAVCK